ncbi:hypothetical protein EV424DRAFT_1535148 [Suillus variegatus]|nr:hypothetical protein EV424DRAFT_1535148 [Suillus variegatus]
MPFMMDISQLLAPLDEYDLTFPDLTAFVQLACMTKPFIHQCMTDIRHPPIHPPEVVVSLLAGALSQDPLTILACWVAFRQVIWTHGAVLPTDQEIEVFNCHGLVRGVETLTSQCCISGPYPNNPQYVPALIHRTSQARILRVPYASCAHLARALIVSRLARFACAFLRLVLGLRAHVHPSILCPRWFTGLLPHRSKRASASAYARALLALTAHARISRAFASPMRAVTHAFSRLLAPI